VGILCIGSGGLPADLFRVSFFQDDGSGNPAISPLTTFMDTATRAPTGVFDATGETIYRYDLLVTSPFALTGGRPYYLPVVNEFDVNAANANWYWPLSDASGSNYYRFAVNDPWQSDITGNLAFNINVIGATAVPESANLWLFLMGSVLLGLVVKIHKTRREMATKAAICARFEYL